MTIETACGRLGHILAQELADFLSSFPLEHGVGLGVLSAVRVHRWPDRLVSLGTLVAYAMPTFWLGLMAIVLFSARLHWLPSGGMTTVSLAPSRRRMTA